MGTGTDDFKQLTRGFHPEVPTQAMPTPRTCGQKTLAQAMATVREARRVQATGAYFAWRLGLQKEHGLYDSAPYEPLSWLKDKFESPIS